MSIPDTVFTLAGAKAHLRVPHAEEDALITAMLDAAVGAVERHTRRAWTKRHWTTLVDACDTAACSCDNPAVWHALLSPANVQIFTGVPEPSPAPPPPTLPPADFYYSVEHGHTVVNVRSWPTPGGEGVVGAIAWAAEPPVNPDGAVPPDIYAAVMLYLGDMYENREAQVVGISVARNPLAEKLLAPYVIDMHL